MSERFTLLNRCMRGGRRWYAGAAVAVVLSTACGYLSPFVLRFAIDSVMGSEPAALPGFLPLPLPAPQEIASRQDGLWQCGWVMVALSALQGLFAVLKTVWASKASERFAEHLRNSLYDHINRLPFLAQATPATGDLIQRCSSDVETVRSFVESQAVEIWRVLMMVGIALPLMLILDVRMAIASTFLLPVVLGCSVVYFMAVRRRFQEAVEVEARMTTVVQENVTGVRLVRAFQRQAYEAEAFGVVNGDYRERVLRLVRLISLFWAFSACLCMGQITLTVLVGTVRVVHGTLTLGTLALFITYVTLLVWPVRMLGHVLSDLGRTHVSLGRILQILQQPAETVADEGAGIRPEVRGCVEFRGVGFSYRPDAPPALSEVSFVAEPGQSVAIIGRTGSGKSTLVNLIPRLLDYSQGSILIDGHELRAIDRQWVRQHVGIVLQEPFLFSRTIRDNIALASAGDPSDADVLDVAETAAIHDTIEHTFADGYRTLVGERGVTLSGGQKQRIAIARALLPDPRILVFDDSLSAVDAETDARIRDALDRRRGRATTFIVSHRVSTVSRADLILVLEDGRLVQSGTHGELSCEPGLYRRICRIQDELAEEIRQVADPKDGG